MTLDEQYEWHERIAILEDSGVPDAVAKATAEMERRKQGQVEMFGK